MKLFSKSALSGATCLETAAIAAALIGLAGPTTAFAQDAAAEEAAAGETTIVVTGSRILSVDVETAQPLVIIDRAQIERAPRRS